MPGLRFGAFVLLVLHLYRCVAQTDSTPDYFDNPPAANADESLTSDVVWTVGSLQVITWYTTITEPYNLDLWFNNPGKGSTFLGTIQSYAADSTGSRTYDAWSVDNMGASLPGVYFLWMNATTDGGLNGLGFTSHYFNITAAASSSSSSTSTAASSSSSSTSMQSVTSSSLTQASSTPTASSSALSTPASIVSATPTASSTLLPTPANNSLAVGLGAGLGVGVALLFGIVAWLLVRRYRKKKSAGGSLQAGEWPEKTGNSGVANYAHVDAAPYTEGFGASRYEPVLKTSARVADQTHHAVELDGAHHPVELST